MQSLSLTSVSPVPSLKPWKDKQDSRDGLIKSSRAAVKPFLFSILLGGSGCHEKGQQTQRSFCSEGGEALSRVMETFSEPRLGKTSPPRAAMNFDSLYGVPWPIQNSCSRD